jgi:hypothetical protein
MGDVDSSTLTFLRLRRAYTPPANLSHLSKFPGGNPHGVPLPPTMLMFLPWRTALCVHPPVENVEVVRFLPWRTALCVHPPVDDVDVVPVSPASGKGGGLTELG